MEFKYNVKGKNRKKLAETIGAYYNSSVKYMGAPSFSYRVNLVEIDKNGSLIIDDSIKKSEYKPLIDYLKEKGYEIETSGDVDVEGYQISVPCDDKDTLFEYRITKLINAKANLFKKAFNTSDLKFEIKDKKITFDWLDGNTSQEMIQASIKFFCNLVKMIKEGKRVNCKEQVIVSEKYAFRCFLLRLGFIGDEYKLDRKILMQNLSGSSAFRIKKEGNENDNQ